MTSIGHIITSLLPQSDCPPLPLVVTVDVQSGGGQSNWQSTEEFLNTEEIRKDSTSHSILSQC